MSQARVTMRSSSARVGAPLPRIFGRGEQKKNAGAPAPFKKQGRFCATYAYPSSSVVRDGYARKVVERRPRAIGQQNSRAQFSLSVMPREGGASSSAKPQNANGSPAFAGDDIEGATD